MEKSTLLKLLSNSPEDVNEGFTLVEVLVSLVISGIILTAAASALVNLLKANRDVELKTDKSLSLAKALAYIQSEVQAGASVTQEAATSGGNCDSNEIDSDECMVVGSQDNNSGGATDTSCDGPDTQIYYGYQDISSGAQTWLKPGVLKRKEFTQTRTGTTCTTSSTNWAVIADGLLSVNEDNPVADFANNTDFCSQNLSNWSTGNLYGADSNDKGGFRFCLNSTNADNILARIFLFGYVPEGNENNIIAADVLSLGRNSPSP